MLTKSSVSVVTPILDDKGMISDQKIVPGTTSMGRGVYAFGGYCTSDSIKLPIIDLGDFDKEVEGGYVTSHLLDSLQAHDGLAKSISGKTLHEYSKNFAASVNVKGSYAFFSGEISASMNTEASTSSSMQYWQRNDEYYYWRLAFLDPPSLADHMTKTARKHLEKEMSPTDIIKNYGTHFLQSASIGARCSFCCSIDTTVTGRSEHFAAAVSLAYKNLTTSASGSASADVESIAKDIQEKKMYQVRVVGGDQTAAHAILQGDYSKWLDSARQDDMQAVADFANGLTPIYELIKDEKRKAQIKAAYDDECRKHGLPPLPYIDPVYHCYADRPTRHYYTADPTHIPAKFSASDTPFHAFKSNHTPDGDTIQEAVPVYRLKSTYNPDTGKSSGGPLRFKLSLSNSTANQWTSPEVAFYAYNTPGEGRVAINSFTRDGAGASTQGWYYSTASNVKGWKRQAENKFFAPKA